MMNLRNLFSFLILTLSAVALTITTVILAPLPLILLRRNGGLLSFFAGTIIGAAGLVALGSPAVVAVYLLIATLAFVFTECERQGLGFNSAALITLLVVSGVCAIMIGHAVHAFGLEPVEFMRTQLDLWLAQVTLPPGMTIDKEMVIRQVPSALVILTTLTLWMNALLTPKMEVILGWTPSQKAIFQKEEFLDWKLPDEMVWLALASIAGRYFELKPEILSIIATNVFNVMLMLYFFQGLAVVVNFFNFKKVSIVWRLIAYVFIFSQLFLAVSFLGFVDLWFEFRKRTKIDPSAVA